MYNYIMEENNVITKEYIESMGYVVEEISTNIFMVLNFLKDAELDIIIDEAESATQDDWSTHYTNGLIDFAEKKFGRRDLENLISEGKVEVTLHWADKNLGIKNKTLIRDVNKRLEKFYSGFSELEAGGIRTLQRQYENSPLPAHIDNHTDPSLKYATIIYVNDNYTDGELYFVNQDIKVKPPAGAMMIFPTGEEFEHGVESPGPGPTRYVLPVFVSYKNFYENNKF